MHEDDLSFQWTMRNVCFCVLSLFHIFIMLDTFALSYSASQHLLSCYYNTAWLWIHIFWAQICCLISRSWIVGVVTVCLF